jgi:hypothetical protein
VVSEILNTGTTNVQYPGPVAVSWTSPLVPVTTPFVALGMVGKSAIAMS